MPISGATDIAAWLAGYKEYRQNLGAVDANRDARINAMLRYVVAWAEKFCGRPLVATAVTSVTEILDGMGTELIVVKNTPVVALTSVSTIDDAGTTTALTAGTYRIENATGVISMIGSDLTTYIDASAAPNVITSPAFPRGHQNVQVVYTYGQTAYANIPDDIKYAVFKAADRALAAVGVRDANYSSLTDESQAEFMRTLFRTYRANVIA